MPQDIEFREGFDPSWTQNLLELHNKTELKRNDPSSVREAFQKSFAVVTGWSGGRLVGAGRMLSDGRMYASIFDVVVDPEYQRRGIGRGLMRRLLDRVPDAAVHLTSTFGNEEFYWKLGFRKHKTSMALYPPRAAASPYLDQSWSPKKSEGPTMYRPDFFSVSQDKSLELIARFPLAELITVDSGGEVFANPVPLIASSGPGGGVRLRGHLSRRNPQWRHLSSRGSALAVFRGPDAYVTPSWYVSGRDVPTWNYAVVQARGRVRLIEEPEGLIEILRAQTDFFESKRSDPWKFELPGDLEDPRALAGAIIGFELDVTSLEAKFKLSQNRSREDRSAVIEGLREGPLDAAREVARLMEENQDGNS